MQIRKNSNGIFYCLARDILLKFIEYAILATSNFLLAFLQRNSNVCKKWNRNVRGTKMSNLESFYDFHFFLWTLCKICLIAAIAQYLQRASYFGKLKPITLENLILSLKAITISSKYLGCQIFPFFVNIYLSEGVVLYN